jgi:TRAP-type C4-dicarboxylate transport system permease small subunit
MTLRPLVRAIEALVLLGMAIVAVVVIAEVLLRYSIGWSLIVTEELSRYGMIWVALLGSVLVLREDGHLATGGLAGLGPRGRRAARAVVDLLSLLFLVVLAAAGLQTLPDQLDQQTLTLPVTIFWFYLAIPVCALLMALVIAVRLLGLDRAPAGGAPPPAEP